jgi:hypothetical protein
MKRNTVIALFAIASFAMAGKSFAQDHMVKVKVPFDFTAGNALLPAGTYTIQLDPENLIVIRNLYKPVSAIELVRGDDKKSPNTGKLLFHKYGSQYFLSEILCDSEGMNLMMIPTKREERTRLERVTLNSDRTLVATR